jgi:raffinose/stachyose/melibiose transport system permease protein
MSASRTVSATGGDDRARRGDRVVSSRRRWRGASVNVLYLPAVLLMLAFVAYPLYEAVSLSFSQWNGYSQHRTFVGLDNYQRMLHDPHLLRIVVNTLIYGFGSMFFQNVFGLAIALFLDKRLRGHSIVRAIVYLPVMISGLIMGYIISFFVRYDGGVLNEILGFFGAAPVDFMADGNRGVAIITAVNVWQFTGICMVIYLGGLQNISKEYLESATLDGAIGWARFRYITVPLLVPAMATAVVVNLIGGLKLFDVIMSLTAGGPGFATHSLSSYISNQYFQAQNAGYSAALGIFTFVLIAIVSTIFTRAFRARSVEA